MAYLGIAFILAIAYFIDWLDTKAYDKQTAKVERTHEEMYALIDEYFDGREARERKAMVDAMIGALYKDNGKEYKPKHIKQVATAEERKTRIKAELDGTSTDDELIKAQLLDALDLGFAYENDEDDWYYEEHTQEEKRENLIQYYIESGATRREAEIGADKFLNFVGGM